MASTREGAFVVMRPNDLPEIGYSEDHRVGDYETAEADAKEIAQSLGRSGSALIHRDGTNEVWSVVYRPEDPVLLGLTASGEANVEWPVEFRITHDPTEEELDLDPDTEEVVARRIVGQVTSRDEVPATAEPEETVAADEQDAVAEEGL